MSSIRPSKLVIADEDDDWGTISPLPTASSRPPSVVSSSDSSFSTASRGEFNPFSTVGAVLSGGVVAKREVWVLEHEEAVCLGKVGVNNKFCIKPCDPGKRHCGVLRHGSKFAATMNTAYVPASDTQVYCLPSLDLDFLTGSQQELLRQAAFSPAEWGQLFESIQNGSFPEWLIIDDPANKKDADMPDCDDDLALLSPVATRTKHGAFEILPTFSYDSVASDEGCKNTGEPIPLTMDDRVLKMESRLKKLKSKLTAPFIEIDASYAMVTSDLVRLRQKIMSVSDIIGSHCSQESLSAFIQKLSQQTKHLDSAGSNMADQICKLISDQEDVKVTLNSVVDELTELQAVSVQTESWKGAVDKTLDMFKRRFANIKPILARISEVTAPFERCASLESPKDNLPHDTLMRKLQDLEEKLKVIENRVVGAGVQLGGLVFQSFDDLYKWVQIKLPKGRFGFFVDGHSFLEFFTLAGHIDTEAGTTAFSNSQKAGFSTYIEAQLAVSFKNLFPSVFGKGGSSSLDDSECLPAISTGDKWNNGSTGIHHQLMRNMNDVSYQIDSSIKKVFKDHHEAKQLAIDCVTASKRFVIDLITFMSQEYSTWQQRGFSSKAAWRIVCQIVRRIFEDMQSARISARNVQDWDDIDFTTATFVYATLKCHDIMEVYVRHQFHSHPHVSSVITRHLAANFVKPEESVEAKQVALESKVKALATKVDSHTSKIELLVSKEKENNKKEKERAKKFKGKADEGDS
jgi:hypothetical protein